MASVLLECTVEADAAGEARRLCQGIHDVVLQVALGNETLGPLYPVGIDPCPEADAHAGVDGSRDVAIGLPCLHRHLLDGEVGLRKELLLGHQRGEAGHQLRPPVIIIGRSILGRCQRVDRQWRMVDGYRRLNLMEGEGIVDEAQAEDSVIHHQHQSEEQVGEQGGMQGIEQGKESDGESRVEGSPHPSEPLPLVAREVACHAALVVGVAAVEQDDVAGEDAGIEYGQQKDSA